jgi:hypothetical protein
MGDQHKPAAKTRFQGPPSGAARSGQPPAPFELTEDGDTAARTTSALFLQSSAGNRAVASTLAQIRGASRQDHALRVVGSPTSTAAAPRGGVVQISNAAAGMHAAGYTSLPAPGAPDVVLGAPLQQSDGSWQATINPTTVTPDPATSLYPGEGLHDDEPTPDGTPRVRDVTKAASAEIKAGEEEHLMDLEWARHYAYDQVADAVNRAAASGPLTGKTPDDAKAVAMYRVRSEVPDKARWPDAKQPIAHWRRLYGQLVAVTIERDKVNKWHDMSGGPIFDPAERKKLGVPKGSELWRYVAGSTQVGKHPSEPEVTARYQSQPAEPIGPPPASMFTPAPAKPGPTGDFEPQPPGDAVAVRSRRTRR